MKVIKLIKPITWLSIINHGYANGYIALPEDHPWHGMDYYDIPVKVHGGLTFGQMITDEIKRASQAIGSSHIHVGYLSHLVAYGIVGCFFLFGFWFLLVKKLYRTAKQTNYWGSFFAFLTFLWAFATFSHSSIFLYGLIFALVFNKYFEDKFSM